MASSTASPSVRTLVVLASLLLPCLAAPQACSAIAPAATPVFATGYSGLVVNGLKSPRGIMFDTKDNPLIVEQGFDGSRLQAMEEQTSASSLLLRSSRIILSTMASNFLPTDEHSMSRACPTSTHIPTIQTRYCRCEEDTRE